MSSRWFCFLSSELQGIETIFYLLGVLECPIDFIFSSGYEEAK